MALISDKQDAIQRILDKKRYFKKEINVSLFEYCTNNCTFCFQGNDDRTNLSDLIIKRKADLICNLIEKEPNQHLALKIFGGELFEDSIKEEHFKAYKDFILRVTDKCSEMNKTVSVTLVSNLLTKRIERVDAFMSEMSIYHGVKDIQLAASFDFDGRFHTRKQLILFIENLFFLKRWIKSINIVITKQNIDILLQRKEDEIGTVEAFKTIYENFDSIACDYYNPDLNSCHISMPTDDDLLDFFYYAIDNYPKIMPVNGWVSGRECDLSCEATIGISSRGRIRNCRDTTVACDDLFWSEDNHKDNSAIENSFINRYGCFKCPWYKRCTMGCFLFFDFKYRSHYEECIFCHIFNYLETGEKTYGQLIHPDKTLEKLSQSLRRPVKEGEFELGG